MASPFITYNDARKFEVNPDAARTLSKLKGPVAVLAVCGRARQGKSWLLNQILTKLNGRGAEGFQVASSHRPCTKGLWIWGQAIPRTLPTGQKYHLLLVDCEGIDAFDQTLDYSTQIFSLGVLLSSMLIYNQMGAIDESSVDKLSCVCEFAKRIKSKAGAADNQEIQALSPSFLWLLRDTYLTLDAGMATPKDYMEEVLRAGGDANKDQTRASIKDVFPSRDCYALIRPLSEEGQLAAMDRIPYSHLREDFKKGMDKLLGILMANATPKQFRGSYITGSALSSFAQAFVRVINEGGVPSLSSTWQAVIEAENRQAMDAGMETYDAHIAPATTPTAARAPGCVEALEAAHLTALEAGILAYRQKALGVSPQQSMESEAKLRAAMVSRFQPLMAARVAEADMRSRDMLSARALRLAELLGKDPLDADALHVQLGDMLLEYNAQASGPNKFKLAVEFMVNDVARPLADAATRATQTVRQTAARAEDATRELAEAHARLAALQQQMGTSQQDAAAARQQLANAQAECARAKEAASQSQVALARAEASKEHVASEVAEARAQADRLQEQLLQLQSGAATEAVQVKQQLEAAVRREQEALAAAAAEQAKAQGQEQELKAEVGRLQALQMSLQSELDYRGQEVAQLQKQLEKVSSSMADFKASADKELANLQVERTFLQEQIMSMRQQLQQQQQQQQQPAPEAEMQDAGLSEDEAQAPQRKKVKAARTPASAAQADEAGPSSAGPKSGGSNRATPFSHEKEVPMSQGPASGGAKKRKHGEDAPAPRQALQLPEGVTSVDKMTVQQIKDWLTTEAKAESEVFELSARNGKKADFVKLAKRKLGLNA